MTALENHNRRRNERCKRLYYKKIEADKKKESEERKIMEDIAAIKVIEAEKMHYVMKELNEEEIANMPIMNTTKKVELSFFNANEINVDGEKASIEEEIIEN
jgi:hypothetical protein